MNFDSLGLIEPLLRAVKEKGYETPTPVQSGTISAVLDGRDVMASAQTGTGKTAAFTLPILQQLEAHPTRGRNPRVLVITPTRELAAQILDSVLVYGKHLKIRSAVVFGGVNIGPQIRQLRAGVDILIATPGRLLDLHGQGAVHFDDIEILVLDEADRMLDMGFIPDIKRIQARLPAKKQSLLFSATFSDPIRALARTMLNQPLEVDVAVKNAAADTVAQHLYAVDKSQKTRLLSHLIRTNQWTQVLVFTRTKHGANKLVKELTKDGIESLAIHGNKSQPQRTRALAEFKRGEVDVLVATDIAARGIDIIELPHVVNYDMPHVPEDYVHRIGRTGRAGSEGVAFSLVCADEIKQLRDIERLIKKSIRREEVEGFEPTQQLSTVSPPSGGQNNRRRSSAGGVTRMENGRGARNRRSGGRGGNGNSASGNRAGNGGDNRSDSRPDNIGNTSAGNRYSGHSDNRNNGNAGRANIRGNDSGHRAGGRSPSGSRVRTSRA